MRDPHAVRPRTLFCPIEGERSDLRVADEVLAGRFTHAGTTWFAGLPPRWSALELPDDEEWEIEWRKFYYGLDLAHAFRMRGTLAYLEAFEDLVTSFAREGQAQRDSSDVRARRVQSWIYAWQRFAATPAFPGLRHGLADQLVAWIGEEAAAVRAGLSPERNHRTLELTTLFLAALALPKLDPDGSRLAFAWQALHENLRRDVLEDGVQREGSTHYHATVLRNFLTVRENARRFRITIPDGFDERLEHACEYLLHVTAPDGFIPALSDADTGCHLDLLLLAADLFAREDFRFVATRGREGRLPGACRASFPIAGHHVQRSGWGEPGRLDETARFLVFDVGPVGDGGHGHYDALSIFVAAGGSPRIVDPGRFTYHEDASGWRRRFKGTAAHATVCVDALDQTPYRRGKPRAGSAQTRLIAKQSGAGLEAITGEVTSPAYDAVHRRTVIFVAGDWWVVLDQLDAPTPHRFDLRFPLAPDAHGATQLQQTGSRTRIVAPGVALEIAGRGRARLEAGWVSARYGERVQAPVVSLRTQRCKAVRFASVIAPEIAGCAAPRVSLARFEADGRVRVELEGTGPDGNARDVVRYGPTRRRMQLGPFRLVALGGWLRTSAQGEVLAGGALDVAAWRRSTEPPSATRRSRPPLASRRLDDLPQPGAPTRSGP